MAVSEQLVQDVVKEIVAKLQINADVSGSRGVYADMNTAIEAAKKAQKTVQSMSYPAFVFSKYNLRKLKVPRY